MGDTPARMSVDTSTRRRRATIAVVAFAAVGIVLLVGKAERRSSAYATFGVAFVSSCLSTFRSS
jgi:hypothetical protein